MKSESSYWVKTIQNGLDRWSNFLTPLLDWDGHCI